MRVIRVEADCPEDIAKGLESLESEFQYPLGPGRWFSISHGRDYSRFFRSMGTGVSFVALEENTPAGVISGALREIQLPDGKPSRIVYIGDLKIRNSPSRGWALLQLARNMESWGRKNADSAYGVVMDGTQALPGSYSGRLGIPGFKPVRSIWVLRVSGRVHFPDFDPKIRITTPDIASGNFARKSLGRFCCLGGKPSMRSLMEPLGLLDASGESCGILEDTRGAKKLLSNNGEEILSSHLSCFCCDNPASGASLIQTGLQMARNSGFPALFTSCPKDLGPGLVKALESLGLEVVIAPATVFAFGPLADRFPETDWMIHTSEI